MIDYSAIDDRLKNWARVMRTRPQRALSMTGIACERLIANAKPENRPKVWDADYSPSIPAREAEAWQTERVWVQLPVKQKLLLKLVYIDMTPRGGNLNVYAICRLAGVRHRDFDQELKKAQQMMWNRLMLTSSAATNSVEVAELAHHL